MAIQNYADLTNRPFIIDGVSMKKTITILQDAAKTAALKQFTPLAKVTVGAVTSVAGTNTGNGTCTALATTAGGSAVPGAYVLTCTATATHGGTFKLEEPGGTIISNDIVMTAGAGTATIFYRAGLVFTLTDGSTDFIIGDKFTLTVAAGSGKYVPVKKFGKDGAQNVAGIYLGEDIPAATLVAGDVTLCEILCGGCCTVDFSRIASDTDYPLALTDVVSSGRTVSDMLANLGIFTVSTVATSDTE